MNRATQDMAISVLSVNKAKGMLADIVLCKPYRWRKYEKHLPEIELILKQLEFIYFRLQSIYEECEKEIEQDEN